MTSDYQTTRFSPVHDLLDARGAEWKTVADTQVPDRFRELSGEVTSLRDLSLVDLSSNRKIGCRGPRAVDGLAELGWEPPAEVFATTGCDEGGLVARVGPEEYLVECEPDCDRLQPLQERFGANAEGCFLVERQESTFLLTGSRRHEVLARTCGVDLRGRRDGTFLWTQIAGIGCGVVCLQSSSVPSLRIWVDASFARTLWENLLMSVEDCNGSLVGVGCLSAL